jgi:hypothetical protein
MPIHYTLVENKLPNNPHPYRAAVSPLDTVEFEDIIQYIVELETTVGESDIRSVLTDFIKVVARLVLQGMNVNTPVANFRTSIRGGFERKGDSFDPSRHRVMARVNPGRLLNKLVLEQARVVKDSAVEPKPAPEEYYDVNSGELNNTLTPGGLGQVTGKLLKFDPVDPQQGIFFVAADASDTMVEFVGRNKPSELSFIVPSLPPGVYHLEVRAIPYDTGEVRTGTLSKPLTVL